MEGVLVPEIWIAFAEATGIPELKRTTRDEPDYDKLMRYRLDILKEHGLGLKEIQQVIATIDPLPGAKAFLDAAADSETQVIILSDTFEQFAKPLMEKLGWPTLFCNTLEVAPDGEITGYQMRCEKSKLTTVKALQSIGYETIASGDSFNDLGMIQASKAGFLFRSTASDSRRIIPIFPPLRSSTTCWPPSGRPWTECHEGTLESAGVWPRRYSAAPGGEPGALERGGLRPVHLSARILGSGGATGGR